MKLSKKKIVNRIHKNIILRAIFYLNGMSFHNVAKIKKIKKSKEEIFEYQQKKIVSLLDYAKKNTKHYKEKLVNLDISQFEKKYPESFQKIPVLKKSHLRHSLKHELYTRKSNRTFERTTSGSTGNPVIVIHDLESYSKQIASRFQMLSWHGITPGDREARFWGRRDNSKTSSFKDFLLNRRRFQFIGSDEDLLSEANLLHKYNPDYIYGYSSLILNAAYFWKKMNLQCLNLKAVICTAETIEPFQKHLIEEAFCCPVFMEYGCSEVDIIAFQCEHSNYHVNTERVFLETESNNQIIITDLNNYSMPLIRYRLDDYGKISDEDCLCGRQSPVLTDLKGRSSNRILSFKDGSKVHSSVFGCLFNKISEKGFEIIQFKIVQSQLDNLVIYLETSESVDRNEIIVLLKVELEKITKTKINYEFVFGKIEPVVGSKHNYCVPFTK